MGTTLRKLLSILLLAIFGLPFVSPLFAATAKSEAGLPMCCRKGGKHECMTGHAVLGAAASMKPTLRAPVEKCPYYPASVFVSSHVDLGFAPAMATYAGLVSHPAVHAQTESMWRIARDRSRQKRGPPALSLL